MPAPTVSIVMPVYNAGMYLRAAVESILGQTFRDFELILVDDGATDGSGGLCDRFAVTDPRIRVIHQANGGICRARNVGMAAATGSWLAFSDHDDIWEPAYLETALQVARRTSVPIVKVNHTEWLRAESGESICREAGGQSRVQDGVLRVDDFWSTREGYQTYEALSAAVWDGIYDRKAVEASGVRFDERLKHGGEDLRFMAFLLHRIRCAAWVSQPLYRHYHNFGVSTSARCHLDLLDSYLETAREERRIFPSEVAEVRFAAFLRWVHGIVAFVFGAPDCPLSRKEKIAWIRRYYKDLCGRSRKIRADVFPLRHRFVLFCMKFRMEWLYLTVVRA